MNQTATPTKPKWVITVEFAGPVTLHWTAIILSLVTVIILLKEEPKYQLAIVTVLMAALHELFYIGMLVRRAVEKYAPAPAKATAGK